MKIFNIHTGTVAPLDRENVDTDAIIPKQFLKSIHKTGFGINLFDEWRYLDAGYPGQDPDNRQPNPDFILNHPRFINAPSLPSILLARKNFGCGSSREHAPWALDQYGFRVVIAPSYADIFFNNCFKNGILPIVLPENTISSLFDACLYTEGFSLVVDLNKQTIKTQPSAAHPNGEIFDFEVQPFRKHCLINGLDDIGLTLQHAAKIREFEAKRLTNQPWLVGSMVV